MSDKTENRKFIMKALMERRTELGRTQDLTPFGGPSRTIVGDAERTGVLPHTAMTRAKLAKGLRWKPDACSVLEQGEVPEEEDRGMNEEKVRSWIEVMRMQLDAMEDQLKPE